MPFSAPTSAFRSRTTLGKTGDLKLLIPGPSACPALACYDYGCKKYLFAIAEILCNNRVRIWTNMMIIQRIGNPDTDKTTWWNAQTVKKMSTINLLIEICNVAMGLWRFSGAIPVLSCDIRDINCVLRAVNTYDNADSTGFCTCTSSIASKQGPLAATVRALQRVSQQIQSVSLRKSDFSKGLSTRTKTYVLL